MKDKKDAEEQMTELTDKIHSLFRGYANGFYAHKEEHLRLLNENEKINQYLRRCNELMGRSVMAFMQDEQAEIDDEMIALLNEINSDSSVKLF